MTDKILIVDDEAPIRRLLMLTLEDLEDEGIEILVAEDGHKALELIKEENPALVLLDVMMPGVNGFEVCDTIKNKLGMAEVIVILLTAKGQEVDRRRGEEVGANQYITKPFDPDDLFTQVVSLLGLDYE